MTGPNPVTAAEIVKFLDDRAVEAQIDDALKVSGPAPLVPGRAGCISFVGASAATDVGRVSGSLSSMLLVPPGIFESLASAGTKSLVAVDDPRLEFARVSSRFFVTGATGGISPLAFVAETAIVGLNTTIAPGAYVADGVRIGADCYIAPNAVVLEGTTIGDRSSVGPNSTIGHVGFGYARERDGTPVLLPHSGGVQIGAEVDIGANSCIDRGTMDDTIVEDEVKIDNLVHVAHNCHIERGAFIIASSVLCGGVRVGANAWIAPNATVREQRTIGVDVVVGLSATVINDVADGTTVVGSPARTLTNEP